MAWHSYVKTGTQTVLLTSLCIILGEDTRVILQIKHQYKEEFLTGF